MTAPAKTFLHRQMVFRGLAIALTVLLGSWHAEAHRPHHPPTHYPPRQHRATASHVVQAAHASPSLIAPLRRLPSARRLNAVCLALTVYHEARGMAHAGQIAVAQVVENRAGRDNRALCATVSQHHQFSWTAQPARRLIPREPAAWEHAQAVAAAVMHHHAANIAGGATHFYNRRVVHPAWSRHQTVMRVIGPMVFVRLRRQPST